jgi:hypothetical protein
MPLQRGWAIAHGADSATAKRTQNGRLAATAARHVNCIVEGEVSP